MWRKERGDGSRHIRKKEWRKRTGTEGGKKILKNERGEMERKGKIGKLLRSMMRSKTKVIKVENGEMKKRRDEG